jgi:hypothetical protein
MAALLSASVVSAQAAAPGKATAVDIPPRIEAFLESCETARRGAIARLEFELRGLQSRGANSDDARRRVGKIQADLRTLRANKEPVVPALRFPPEVGDIGRLPRLSCRVEQILASDEMLVRCTFRLKVRTVQRFQPRYETVSHDVSFLIRRLPARQASVGSEIELLDVFEITGTRTNTSRAGQSITVKTIEPFDMKAVQPYFRSMASRP